MVFSLYENKGKEVFTTTDLNKLNDYMQFNGIDYIILRIKVNEDNDIIISLNDDSFLVIENYDNEYCHEF